MASAHQKWQRQYVNAVHDRIKNTEIGYTVAVVGGWPAEVTNNKQGSFRHYKVILAPASSISERYHTFAAQAPLSQYHIQYNAVLFTNTDNVNKNNNTAALLGGSALRAGGSITINSTSRLVYCRLCNTPTVGNHQYGSTVSHTSHHHQQTGCNANELPLSVTPVYNKGRRRILTFNNTPPLTTPSPKVIRSQRQK